MRKTSNLKPGTSRAELGTALAVLNSRDASAYIDGLHSAPTATETSKEVGA